MIKKVERVDGTAYEVYGMRPPCSSPCKHKECARGRTRKVYVGACSNEREAKALDRRHTVTQEQIADGTLPPEMDLKRTLREASTEWLAALLKSKSRSHESYRDRLNLYILPMLGDTPIARLTKSQLMRWRDDLATRFAPATVNGCLGCGSSALAYFVDRDWLDADPSEGVAKVESPERPYNWIQSREEITKLLVQCPNDVRDIVALALGSGMRLDELLHLQWVDVDLERRLLHIHRGRQGTTKSGRARFAPILDCVLGMLKERALRRGGAELVFPGKADRDGKVGPRSQPGVRDAFKLAVKRAGLNTKLRFHDCRHTMASQWVLDRGCIFALSKLLGHHSVTVTEASYAHLRPNHWDGDWGRVAFVVPQETPVYEFQRGVGGRLTDRVLKAVS